MLINEVDIHLSLDHPNIAKIYNVYEDERAVYMILEMGAGRDILSLISRERVFSERNAAFIMEALMSAVTYLHSCGVAHRDLKLDNLVLKQEDARLEDNTLKLIDFGLAKRFKQGQSNFKTLAGTPLFIAPEVWMRQKYNEKCDVWSCGVIMYVLLSGCSPFEGEENVDISHSVRNDRLSFTNPVWSRVSSEAKDFVKQMLIKDPAQRITMADALQNEWTSLQQLQRSARANNSALEHWNGQMYNNFKRFSAKNRFQKAATVLVAHLLDDVEISHLRRTFKALDVNNNGKLSLKEIQTAFENEGLNNGLEELFRQIDFSTTSEIDYSTFIAAMMDQKFMTREEYLWRAFKSMDQSNSGSITIEDLGRALHNLGGSDAPIDPDEVKNIMANADTNHDGEISFEEFSACICGPVRPSYLPSE